MATLRLLEQKQVMQFSHSLLARTFVLRSMSALAFSTAISNELASASLQFDVIDLCDAAASTTHHVSLCIYANHTAFIIPSVHKREDKEK